MKKFENISDWRESENDSRCFIDSARNDLAEFLREKNFVFIERTIQATIPLKNSADFKKFCRLPLETSELNERIREIAKKSFSQDVRFFDSVPPVMNENLLEDFLSEMKTCYICRVKNEIAGFIEVVESEEKSECIIRLAAVDENFRLSGAALSLYARAADLWREKSFRKITGRISTKNIPVVNLYATLGANFSRPQDVYIRG